MSVALAANHLGTIAAAGLDPLPRAIAGLAAGVGIPADCSGTAPPLTCPTMTGWPFWTRCETCSPGTLPWRAGNTSACRS